MRYCRRICRGLLCVLPWLLMRWSGLKADGDGDGDIRDESSRWMMDGVVMFSAVTVPRLLGRLNSIHHSHINL